MREIKSSPLLVGGFCLALLVVVIADQSYNYTLAKDDGCDTQNTPTIEAFDKPEAITQSDFEWSEWGECSADCGRSFSTRQRRLRQDPDLEILRKIFSEDELDDPKLLKELSYELDSKPCMVKPCTYCLRPLRSNRNDLPPESLFQNKKRIFKDLVPSTECRYPDYDPLNLPYDPNNPDQVFIYVPMDDVNDENNQAENNFDPAKDPAAEVFNVSHIQNQASKDDSEASVPCPGVDGVESPPPPEVLQHGNEEMSSLPGMYHPENDDEMYDADEDYDDDEEYEEEEEGDEDEDQSYDEEDDNISLHEYDEYENGTGDFNYGWQVENDGADGGYGSSERHPDANDERGNTEQDDVLQANDKSETLYQENIVRVHPSKSAMPNFDVYQEQAKVQGPIFPEKDTCTNPEYLRKIGRHYTEMCHPDEGNLTSSYTPSFQINEIPDSAIIILGMITLFLVLLTCLNKVGCETEEKKESKERLKVVSNPQVFVSCDGDASPVTKKSKAKSRSRKIPVVTSELRRSPRRSSCRL